MSALTIEDKKNLIAAIIGCQNRSARREANIKIFELAKSIDESLTVYYCDNCKFPKDVSA